MAAQEHDHDGIDPVVGTPRVKAVCAGHGHAAAVLTCEPVACCGFADTADVLLEFFEVAIHNIL